MKIKLTIILVLFSFGYSFSQTSKNIAKPTIGTLFNFSIPTQSYTEFTSVIRATYPVYKKISLGAEFNYIQQFGKYVNSDYAGAIAFAKINPYLGFVAELGYSYNKIMASTRNKVPATKGLFAAIGYQVKLSKRVQIEFQYRTLPAKYLETDVVNNRIYLLGLNYSFK